ncbi:MAG: tetratricopeptide repeat protein, partial [Verrucomicrobia bacterium]|nr:tetratricopeptide repeat protein [Verrucomicrobiota bacterium]
MPLLRALLLLLASAALVSATPADDAALALFQAKKYPEARAAFEQIAAASPDQAAAHYYLGVLATRRGDTDEAVAQLERATTLAPANSLYFAELGGAYGSAAQAAGLFSKLGWAKKCREALEKSVALDPANLAARNGLVTFYQQAPGIAGGGMDKAYAEAAEIRQRDPRLGTTILAQLYVVDKKYDEAFALLNELLKTSPDNYVALFCVGRTAAQTGQRIDYGEKCLRRCLELTPAPG